MARVAQDPNSPREAVGATFAGGCAACGQTIVTRAVLPSTKDHVYAYKYILYCDIITARNVYLDVVGGPRMRSDGGRRRRVGKKEKLAQV